MSRETLIGSLLLSMLGGSSGAVLFWWLTEQLATPAAVVVATIPRVLTTLGWFASARLSESAQRRMLRHNLLNTARGELVRAIRANAAWANRLGMFGMLARNGWQHAQLLSNQNPAMLAEFGRDRGAKLRDSLYAGEGGTAELVMLLEEYELLFKPTRFVRWQLAHYSMTKIHDPVSASLSGWYSGNPSRIEASILAMEQLLDVTSEYQAVLEDLLAWIQNAALSEITGERVPPRQPKDPKLARIIEGPEGELRVMAGDTPWDITPDPLENPPVGK